MSMSNECSEWIVQTVSTAHLMSITQQSSPFLVIRIRLSPYSAHLISNIITCFVHFISISTRIVRKWMERQWRQNRVDSVDSHELCKLSNIKIKYSAGSHETMNNWRFLRETSFWCRPARCALRVTALQEAWHVTLLWHGSRTIGHLQLSIDTHIVSPPPSCPTARTSFTPVWRRHLLRLVWI